MLTSLFKHCQLLIRAFTAVTASFQTKIHKHKSEEEKESENGESAGSVSLQLLHASSVRFLISKHPHLKGAVT